VGKTLQRRQAGEDATPPLKHNDHNFLTICRIPLSPFVVIVKAGQLARLKTVLGDDMPQYLVSGYLPDNFDPSTQDEATVEEIHALNREMIAAGVRKLAGGLGPARTLRAHPNGELLLTDGPYLEAKEHVGGLWILECAGIDEVLAWARKSAKVCRFPVEVREIFFMPAPEKD
jgi:hypothetical protein